MILTPNQIEEISNLINFQHVQFISENVGKDVLTSSDIELLEKFGISEEVLPKFGIVDDAFKFGILSEALGEAQLKKFTYDQFKQFLEQGKGIQLSRQEVYALNNIKQQTYSDIKGLGNKVVGDFQDILIEESQKQRKKYEKIIQDTAGKTIIDRKSVKDMVSELGHKTGDWSRDFGRISDYVLHQAFDTGRSEAIKDKFGEEQLVYKEVYPGACKHCIKLYTTSGVGSEPILFKLSELEGNGNNIGRKTKDWKAVIGPTHPWCRCTLRRVPEGYKWSSKTRSFSIPTGERKMDRKSKVKVKFNE